SHSVAGRAAPTARPPPTRVRRKASCSFGHPGTGAPWKFILCAKGAFAPGPYAKTLQLSTAPILPISPSGTPAATSPFFGWKFRGNKRLVRRKPRLLSQAGGGDPRLFLGVDSCF